MGPPTIAQPTALPLPTTEGLAGTSVTITVGAVTVTAPMIYSLKTQVAVVLPSNTPVGAGVVTVVTTAKGINSNSGGCYQFGHLNCITNWIWTRSRHDPRFSLITGTTWPSRAILCLGEQGSVRRQEATRQFQSVATLERRSRSTWAASRRPLPIEVGPDRPGSTKSTSLSRWSEWV